MRWEVLTCLRLTGPLDTGGNWNTWSGAFCWLALKQRGRTIILQISLLLAMLIIILLQFLVEREHQCEHKFNKYFFLSLYLCRLPAGWSEPSWSRSPRWFLLQLLAPENRKINKYFVNIKFMVPINAYNGYLEVDSYIKAYCSNAENCSLRISSVVIFYFSNCQQITENVKDLMNWNVFSLKTFPRAFIFQNAPIIS